MVFTTILIASILSAVSCFIVARTAHKMALIDVPNERSSHSLPTPRGGGIGIWLAFVVIGIFVVKENILTLILGMAGLLGFFEDCFTLSSKIRLLIQFILAALAVWFFWGMPVSMISVGIFLFWLVFITGTTNFYNFMDGINGIAGLTGIVSFGLLALFCFYVMNEPHIGFLSLVLVVACVGFMPFNFPTAKIFMGDVGSVFLGFVFSAFVVKLSGRIDVFLCLIMFLCTFYADAIVTLYTRWRKGERMMEAHRSHLYQYLSNERGMPHWKVALLYTLAQLVFGALAIGAFKQSIFLQITLIGIYGILFIATYKYFKTRTIVKEAC